MHPAGVFMMTEGLEVLCGWPPPVHLMQGGKQHAVRVEENSSSAFGPTQRKHLPI